MHPPGGMIATQFRNDLSPSALPVCQAPQGTQMSKIQFLLTGNLLQSDDTMVLNFKKMHISTKFQTPKSPFIQRLSRDLWIPDEEFNPV